eukprot:CAMPEP_0197862334 /NCGR_PEP_ID=MMETSP1438-20131217/39020_1 /TAXON_ID=1461541 /ORGANISM="Pterosperma sp., Strain CCMP1384" /LENGTH=46 /DNA_ID= /DNA_START= /DNA_END= /DNA_ORIENTATION=
MTKRELLVALDGTLDNPFFPREVDGSGTLTDEGAKQAWGREEAVGL